MTLNASQSHYIFTTNALPKTTLLHRHCNRHVAQARHVWLPCRCFVADCWLLLTHSHTKDAYLNFFVGDWRTGWIKCRDYGDDLGRLWTHRHTHFHWTCCKDWLSTRPFNQQWQAAMSRAQCQQEWIDSFLVVTSGSKFTSDTIAASNKWPFNRKQYMIATHKYDCNRLYPYTTFCS